MQKIARKPGNRLFSGTSVFKIFSAACALLALCCLLSPSQARAQLVTADVLGTVTDTTGAVIPNAKVTLLNTGTGISASMKSNATGEFLFSHVQIGTFKITVEATGFKTFMANGITAGANDRVRIGAKLDIGNQVETVEVQASAAVELQTDSSDIGSQISANAVADMPVNGRNVYDLLALQAGTTSSTGSSDPTDARPTMAFSANGQSSVYNNNMIDGMDNNERSLGSVAVEPSMDALEEVRVETNMYSAEYSRTGGGIANLITKSGTNKFHGTLFEFIRNDAFDAYPWTSSGENKTKAELRQNQFGGSFGGPILKNKAFFFGDYQGWRQVQGAIKKLMVPTAAEYASIHGYTKGGTIDLADQWGSTVSVSNVNPLGLAYVMMSPKPLCDGATGCDSSDSYNWYGSANQIQHANTYDGRVDYHINDKNTLFGRLSYNKTDTTKPGANPTTTIVNGDSHTYSAGTNINPVVEKNIALDYVHVFSPAALFEGKASYLRSDMQEKSPNDSYWNMSTLGFSCTDIYCYDSAGVYGLPLLSMKSAAATSTYSGNTAPYTFDGDGGELGYIENTFQYNASLTLNKKAHSFKMGVTLIRRQASAPTSSTTGITFAPEYTGNVLGDMLEGKSVYVNGRKTMVVPRFRMWEPSGYFQDDWRATKSLTLNLGIRYDIYTPWTEREGHLSNFDLDSAVIVSPSLLGDNQGSPTGNIKTDFGDISPRIGFAYSFSNNNTITKNMVLRGGWGLSYFPANTNGRGAYEMLNTPFIWQMGCGSSAYSNSSSCSSSNNYISTTAYAAQPYGLSDGGYSLAYGLPMAKYDTTLATNTSGYSSSFSGNYFITPNFKPSYLEQFNLQLQKQVGNNIVTAGLVGNLGRRIPTQQNLNQSPLPTATHNPMYSTAHDWMDGVSVIEAISGANSTWVAGEATYERKMTHGFSGNVNYTWSRSEGQTTGASECVLSGCQMDNGSGSAVLVNGWQQYNYDGSTSHRAAGMISYNIPYGKNLHGVLGQVVKGWALNGTGYWQTGAWNQITSGSSQSGIQGRMLTEFPNKVAGVSVKPKHQTLAHWINEDAFALQASNMLGNANKNLVQGPRSRNVDLGFGKIFSVWEDLKLQFRAEAFNFTNTVNYAGAGGGPTGGGAYSVSKYADTTAGSLATTASGFGAMTNQGNSPRIFQFGLKLIY